MTATASAATPRMTVLQRLRSSSAQNAAAGGSSRARDEVDVELEHAAGGLVAECRREDRDDELHDEQQLDERQRAEREVARHAPGEPEHEAEQRRRRPRRRAAPR